MCRLASKHGFVEGSFSYKQKVRFVFVADPLAAISNQKRRVQVGRKGPFGKSWDHPSYESGGVSISARCSPREKMSLLFFRTNVQFGRNSAALGLKHDKYWVFNDDMMDINNPPSGQRTTNLHRRLHHNLNPELRSQFDLNYFQPFVYKAWRSHSFLMLMQPRYI